VRWERGVMFYETRVECRFGWLLHINQTSISKSKSACCLPNAILFHDLLSNPEDAGSVFL
jgi:hypothetical protein